MDMNSKTPLVESELQGAFFHLEGLVEGLVSLLESINFVIYLLNISATNLPPSLEANKCEDSVFERRLSFPYIL